MTLFTIGHSNHSLEKLIGLLQENRIATVVDVRSAPYSRYSPQFTRENLGPALGQNGIHYAYAGKNLGGRPTDPSCYISGTLPGGSADYLRKVDYREVMKREWFIRAIERLLEMAEEQTTAILCSEENPEQCHRHHLIAKYIMDKDPEVHVRHIRGDSTVVEAGTIRASVDKPSVMQASLFDAL